jgi:uncharacterized protein YecE (DUF72 family)
LNIAWEPRGEKWGNKVVAKLCDELDLIHCVDPFARDPAYTKDLVYFRLHGSPPGKRMYAYKYTREDLQALLKKCKTFGRKEVYCLFNNISMYEDALEFQELIK